MLKNRIELEEYLYAIKEGVYRKREIGLLQQEAIKKLKEYMAVSKIVGIMNNRIPLQQLSEQELFYVTNFMYNYLKNEHINIKEWFTDSEISNWINDTIIVNNSNIVEIENVMFNCSELNPEYLCYIPYRKLIDMMEHGQIEYDTNLQRSPKIITKMGKVIEVPTINQNAVMEIKDKMLNGEFYSNQITFNMLNEGNIFWNYYNGKLSIDISKGRLLIIDGYHRLSALLRAYRENGNINGVLHLNIKALDDDGCKNFIWQESLANRHDENTVDRFNINSKITIFINKLNTYRNKQYNPFYREIETAIIKNGIIKEDVFRLILNESKFVDIINNTDKSTTELVDYVCRLSSCIYENMKGDEDIFFNYNFLLGVMFIATSICDTDFDELKIGKSIKDFMNKNRNKLSDLLKLSISKKNTVASIKKLFLKIIRGADINE